MNISQYSTPDQLERGSFLWSQARLVLAAVALLIGGIPPIVYLLGSSGAVWSVLRLGWIISGLASAYLGYRWMSNGWAIFGGKNQKDTGAMLVSIISGLNLGMTGLTGNNLGMSLASGRVVFLLVGVIYLWAAVYLWGRWKSRGEHVF
jgi:uncharacterized membrane protein YuzA (DUF378 family)